MEESKNDFEDLDEEVPKIDTTENTGSMVASGAPGEVYDWKTAPTGTKAPPRADLNGQKVTIKKADIILPPESRPWEKTRAGDKEYKYCSFILHYDKDSQQESMSGVRVFKREENGQEKYSHPTITRDRNNQASKLLGKYADFKEKDINDIALREFLAFLNSAPSVEIQTEEVTNPKTGDVIKKNMVGKFVN